MGPGHHPTSQRQLTGTGPGEAPPYQHPHQPKGMIHMARKTRTAAQRARVARRVQTGLVVLAAWLVGVPALWTSYGHIRAVTLAAGESASVALLMPLTVDGLMLMSGLAIATRRGGWLAYAGFWLGLAASLAANLASADRTATYSYAVATWPAIAVAFASEITLRLTVGRKSRASAWKRWRQSRARKARTRQARVQPWQTVPQPVTPAVNGHRNYPPRETVPVTR